MIKALYSSLWLSCVNFLSYKCAQNQFKGSFKGSRLQNFLLCSTIVVANIYMSLSPEPPQLTPEPLRQKGNPVIEREIVVCISLVICSEHHVMNKSVTIRENTLDSFS